MSRIHSPDQAIIERNRRARDEFLSGATPGPFIIDPSIVRAWQRCMRIGVEPERPVEFKPVLATERRAVIESNLPLVEAAAEEMDQLGRAMVPSGASVILADASLVTIGVRGRTQAMPRELQAACREGVDLSEPCIGSNALTIAVVEHAPSVVINNAHFCAMNAIFACAAAPVRSPLGVVLGVIDVTTCHQALPAEAPFLVNASARAIENAIFTADADRLVVRFHPRADLLGTPMEAAILCSPQGDIVGANESALGLLGLRWPLRGAHFSRVFRLGFADLLTRAGRHDAATLMLSSASGVPLHARVTMPVRIVPRVRSGTVRADGAAHPPADDQESAGRAALPDEPLVRCAAGDESVLAALRRAVQGAALGLPVLVQGEPGSGKLMAARMLHQAGPRQDGPLVVIDCKALDDRTFDERMAAARGGCCVLDEVADLPEAIQARLLRLLQQREAVRAASSPLALDGVVAPQSFQLISTSHLDLHAACEAGRFRYDLFHRLRGLRVELPPLRRRTDRRAQILSALHRAWQARHHGEPQLEPAAVLRLLDHRWPGNFRELEELAALLAATVPPQRTIAADDLPPEIGATVGRIGASPPPDATPAGPGADDGAYDGLPGGLLRDMQLRAISRAIDKHRGNLSQAARELGVSRGTLYRRLRALRGGAALVDPDEGDLAGTDGRDAGAARGG